MQYLNLVIGFEFISGKNSFLAKGKPSLILIVIVLFKFLSILVIMLTKLIIGVTIMLTTFNVFYFSLFDVGEDSGMNLFK